MKKFIVFFVIVFLCSIILASCGTSVSKTIVGKWYNSSDRCLDIRSDGTYKLENEYGTGTWKVLDDKETIEFTDFYGSTKDVVIEEDDSGLYIKFYGTFYKGAYPSDDASSSQAQFSEASIVNSQPVASQEEESEEVSEPELIQLNPFDGLKLEASGISPYCQIAINNQGCSVDVQKYVSYTLDKDYYANGDKVVLTAVLSDRTDGELYELTVAEKEYNLPERPEYVTSVDGLDMTLIVSELEDYLLANVATATDGRITVNLLGYQMNYLGNVESVENGDVYFSSLKTHKIYSNDVNFFNALSFTFSVEFTRTAFSGSTAIYSRVNAVNIVKYPDGTIKWGSNNLDALDFVAASNDRGMEDCVTTLIMNNSIDYNISKVDWILPIQSPVSSTDE